jgi:integrase
VHLRLYLEKRGKESKHRAQREVAVLGMIFRYARGVGLTKNDPKEAVTLKKLPGRKNVTITDEMLTAVYNAGSVALQDCIDLAYYIGQRPADVLKLADTDIRNGVLSFRQNKTDTPMRITVDGELATVIARIQARKRTYPVVPMYLLVDERGQKMTRAKLRARFEAARTAARIAGADFQFRDLRRKSGTDLRDQAGLDAAQAFLGHAQQAMSEHYTAAAGKKVTIKPTSFALQREKKSSGNKGS